MDINDNVISKAALWADRIHAFQKSGLSRKDWCQQNEISQSTLGYWIRKIQSEIPETGPASDPVFAKLPSEQDLQFNGSTGNHSVTILLSENIRIEIDADCPSAISGLKQTVLRSKTDAMRSERT